MSNIHPTAVIEDGAQIAASAKIGPFCVIGSKAKIGENVQLIAHVTIMNDTTIGDGTIVFPGAVLGGGPQDHGNEFQPEAKLVIGKNNIIRENVTMQCGTPKEHFTTTAGDRRRCFPPAPILKFFTPPSRTSRPPTGISPPLICRSVL